MSELTAYMSLLARLTLKEDDVNSEYHATRKYFAVNVDRTHEIQIFSLTTKLSPQRANERLNIRVSYINFLARLTLKQVEVNTEYHAPRKYCFMVLFVLARDHEQLFQTFRGVWMLISLLFINPISKMSHMNILIFTGEQIHVLSYLHLFSTSI